MSVAYLTGQFGSGLAPGTVPAPAPVNGHAVLRYTHILQRGVEMIPVTPVRLPIIDGVLCSVDGVPSTEEPIEVQATDDPMLVQSGVLAQIDLTFEGGSAAVQAFLQLPTDQTVNIATASTAGGPGAVFIAGLSQAQIADLARAVSAATTAAEEAKTAADSAASIADDVDARVETMVPGLVSVAIAGDPTIADAATSAVNDAASGMGIFQSRGVLPASADFNDYYLTSAHQGVWVTGAAGLPTYTNMPEVVAGTLEVYSGGTGASFQRFTVNATNKTYQRVRNGYSPVTWTAWVPVIDASKGPFVRGFLAAATDLNALIGHGSHAGIWATASSSLSTYKNLPAAVTGILEVLSPGNGAVTQRYTPHGTSTTYQRALVQLDGSSWTAWKKTSVDQDAFAALQAEVQSISMDTDSDPTAPLESSAHSLAMWGDSLTHAGGVTTRLATLLPGVNVVNRGISGQTAGQIAARQGGQHAKLTVQNNTIPTSGPVPVTGRTQALLAQTGYPARSETGMLAGVHGTLSNAEGSTAYTFTRTTPGEATPCPPASRFVTDSGRAARASTQIIWAGRNNPDLGVENYVMAMVRHLSPAVKRFLVVSVTNAPHETVGTARHALITGINERLNYELGDRFVDLRRWLIDEGLSELGLTPTPEDQTAIAGDAVPPSLTTDGVHFTPAAQTIIGDRLHAELVALGWY